MKAVNLTPHTITIFTGQDYQNDLALVVTDIPPASTTYRLREDDSEAQALTLGSQVVPVVERTYWAGTLPAPEAGVIYIVPALCMVQGSFRVMAAGRDDIYCPDTGPNSVVRGANGQILGVRRLIHFRG